MRGSIGSLLVRSGQSRAAIPVLQQAIADLSRLPDAKTPQSYAGYVLITDQFWLGKAYTAMASSTKVPLAGRAEECKQVRSWFKLCIPQFEALRDKGPDYQASDRLDEIRAELSRCSNTPR